MSHVKHALKLIRPLVLAPMAGGPSTPQLCVAVAEAGGLPFLAAGYLSPGKLCEDIEDLEKRITGPYGINLFVPDSQGRDCDRETYRRYRAQVLKATNFDETQLPPEPLWSDDAFQEKLDIILDSCASVVSFTFGHPPPSVLSRIHAAGKLIVLYATSRPGIDAIAASNADVIGIQGPNAGGHRATVIGVDDDSTEPLIKLVEHALSVSDKPVFAGGGIATAADVLTLLRAGATAVQIGTLFLDADEAGTKQTHRRALHELTDRSTVVTRAFTGRPARAIANKFTASFSEHAPGLYPQLHFLTSGLRKKADEHGDVEHLHLWAGTGFSNATSEPAAAIVRRLLPYTPAVKQQVTTDPDTERLRIAVVGGGPRGLAVVERIVSTAATITKEINLDWYDDTSFGAGRVWNPYQTSSLLMNTVSSQLSAFPDASTDFGHRYVHGPTFYDWLQTQKSAQWLSGDPELLAERASITSNTYTSRALYGAYLTWSGERIVRAASPNLRIRLVSQRVVSLDRDGDTRCLGTSDGRKNNYDAVALALGHLPAGLSSREKRRLATAAGANFLYVPPGDATVRTAAKLAHKQRVLLLGLGLTFFDYLELITTRAGGQYVRTEDGLSYIPSEAEPQLYVSSRRGVPFMARGINEKAPNERWEPRFLTLTYTEHLRRMRNHVPISFGRDVWPAIVREVELAYTLAQSDDESAGLTNDAIYAALTEGPASYLQLRRKAGLLSPGFPWEEVLSPRINTYGVDNISEYQQRAIAYLERDITEARRGNKRSPLKAALDVLRDIRNEVRQAVQERTIMDWSFREELNSFYTPFNSFVSIGPPLYRVEQLVAAMRAGTITLLPPDPFIAPSPGKGAATVTGRYFATEPLTVDAVVEARQPRIDALGNTDKLLQHLINTGVDIHRFDDNFSNSGAVSVNPSDFRVLDRHGKSDDCVFLYGIPLEGLHWGTAATIRPFVNSIIFKDANSIVHSILNSLVDE